MLKKNFHLCDRIAQITVLVTVLLVLVVFVPGGLVSLPLIKGYVLVVGISLSLVAWLIARLMEGSLHFSRSWTLLSIGVLAVVAIVSTFFSHAPYLSLFGEQLDQGACIPFVLMCLSVFLASELFQEEKGLSYFFSSAFVLYGILAVYQLVHLFFAGALSFGVFTANVSTPLGLWSDFSYLSGAMLVGSILVHEFFQFPKIVRVIISCVGVLSLFFVVLTNSLLVWLLVGLSLLLVLVYRLLFSEQTEGTRFPIVSFLLTILAIFMSITNASFGGKLASLLHAPYLGIDPSVSATIHVAYESIKSHLLFGVGPNQFFHEWIAYRPLSVNMSMLWNNVFSFGSSFLLTISLLTGIFGILAGIFFVGSFLCEGWKNLFRQSFHSDKERVHPGIFAVFVSTLYFFLIVVFTSPGISITFLSFFFIGLFIAVLTRSGLFERRTIHFSHKKYFGVLLICIIILGTTFSLFGIVDATKRLSAGVHYGRGVRAANAGDAIQADTEFVKAIAAVDLPSIERDRVQLAVEIIQTEFSSLPVSATELSADSKAIIQNAIKVGTSASLAAVSLDTTDAQNFLAYGDFMQALAPLKIQAAFDNSRDAYLKAINVAPNYPVSYYDLARLYAKSGDTKNAMNYASQALTIKSNYTDVYYLEEQIALNQSDVDTAISLLQKAIHADPSNAQIYAELGKVQYDASRYADAVASYGSATTLDSNDTASWFYLAQSFGKTGDTKDASMILTALHARYPDNADIKNALLALTNPAPLNTTTVPDTTKTKKVPVIIPKAKK
ncbi:MAG: tetratricopeptide repeat protein [bacterium]